jgi:GNAT superfamily N-acetyltransferase
VNGAGRLHIAEFRTELTDELLPMWRSSFEEAVGITDPHPLAEQRAYFMREVVPHCSVRVALLHGEIVGFVAASEVSVAQLYVHTRFQRRGIGTLLLDWAKNQSRGSLWLYTFARNAKACTFYERSGFTAVARGFEPMWQLADVRYEWTMDAMRNHRKGTIA